MARHALAPYRYNRTSTVRLGHAPRDDKGEAWTTRVRPGIRTSSPLTGIKHPIVSPETTRGTNRPTLKTQITEEAPTHIKGPDSY
ncbi:hypothetical protein GW17_00007193 [Ensete ventricosum]|nr:hypothetical protein GW17_00007193 [Ensete ventricosum]